MMRNTRHRERGKNTIKVRDKVIETDGAIYGATLPSVDESLYRASEAQPQIFIIPAWICV